MSDSDLWGQLLLESPADGVVVTDAAGTISHWGQGAVRIFGFEPGEAIGQTLDIIVPEAYRARHWDGFHEVMRTGITRYGAGELLSVPALTRDGRRISIEFTLVLIRQAGAVTGTIAVIRDITPRFEELRQLRRQVAALTAGTVAQP